MHATHGYDALGWTFRLASDHPDVAEYVDVVFGGMPRTDRPACEYRIEARADDGGAALALTLDGAPVSSDDDPGRLVMQVVHDVNRRAIDATELLAAHAGGVSRGQDAIVMPAHMESGKTTLTAGLVRAGFDYLSDEAVALEWESLRIVAYPKPLSIDPGSWRLFRELEPDAPFADDGYKREQWQVPPDAIRPGSVGGSCSARFVVFPKYEEGATTELVALGRGDALVELAKNTFRFRVHGRRALETLARLVEGVECYRLPVGDLDAAVAVLCDLVER